MLVLDMLDYVVQTTLRFQAEPALNRHISVKIVFVDLLLLFFLVARQLGLLSFENFLKFQRYV